MRQSVSQSVTAAGGWRLLAPIRPEGRLASGSQVSVATAATFAATRENKIVRPLRFFRGVTFAPGDRIDEVDSRGRGGEERAGPARSVRAAFFRQTALARPTRSLVGEEQCWGRPYRSHSKNTPLPRNKQQHAAAGIQFSPHTHVSLRRTSRKINRGGGGLFTKQQKRGSEKVHKTNTNRQ